jgi:hypothetical protein
MKNEKRRYMRVSVEVDVEVSLQLDKKSNGRVTDISEAGLFVTTGLHVAEGSFVLIKLSDHKIIFGATVRRVAINGFGAEFGSMSKSHRETISKLLSETHQVTVSSVVQTPTFILLCDYGLHPILVNALKAAGFSVLEVSSIDKVIASIDKFDVVGVVSDYIVGGEDTISILRKITEQKNKRSMLVILYSGRYDVPFKQFEEIGIQCFTKSTTTIKNLIGHIKRRFLEDDK